jgi:hypothetical protein
MIRRDFLRGVLYGGTALAATGVGGKAIEDPRDRGAENSSKQYSLPTATAVPFRLEEVRIDQRYCVYWRFRSAAEG